MDLPEEIMEKILMDDNLSYKDLKRMRRTSHDFRRITDSAIERRRKCKHAYLYNYFLYIFVNQNVIYFDESYI